MGKKKDRFLGAVGAVGALGATSSLILVLESRLRPELHFFVSVAEDESGYDGGRYTCQESG